MKHGTWAKKKQYQNILKKHHPFYKVSESLYEMHKNSEKSKIKEDVFLTAFCYVLAPVVLSFVQWVLERARKDGKKRLYFLARDGYMMFRAAELLCRQYDIPIECRYLYCSRYALRSAEYQLLGERSLDYICLGGLHVTFEKMMRRSGLEGRDALAVGRSMGLLSQMDTELSYGQVRAFYPKLRDTPFFMEAVMKKAKERYPMVIGYLRQEGLMDDIPYGIVDSGWTGSMQKSLSALLKSAGDTNEMDGYYFGMYELVKDVVQKQYHTYYFSPKTGSRKKAFFCNNLFECIFSSPEGMTKGYEKKDNRYVPVLEQTRNPNNERIEAGMRIVLDYAKQSGTRTNLPCEKKVISQLLSSFMGDPSIEEAEFFGSYVFCDDVMGEENQPIAARLSREEIKHYRVLQRLRSYLGHKEEYKAVSAWPEGSIVLLEYRDKRQLRQAALYKYLLYSGKSLVWQLGKHKRRQE